MMMKTGAILLSLFILGAGFGVLIPFARQAEHSKAEAQRLADCAQHEILPVRIGDQLLFLPALDNADVWMHGPELSDRVESERSPDAGPDAPLVFCVPAGMGQPPFTISSVRLFGNERSVNASVYPGSELTAALAAFGPVYGVTLLAHREDWNSLPGGSVLPTPDPADPGGMMTVRQSQPDRYGTITVLVRSATADSNGFRYAAHCIPFGVPPVPICTLSIADDRTGLDYYRPIFGISDDIQGWIDFEPVPQAFVDLALDVRRLVQAMATKPANP